VQGKETIRPARGRRVTRAPKLDSVKSGAAKKRAVPRAPAQTVVFTVGHSTRTADEFLDLLRGHGIRLLVDVRTVPRSRHNPQFNQDELRAALRGAHIGYRHLKGLGGLRHPRKDSPNGAWRNASFRGFADYMQTEKFAENLERLIELTRRRPAALMCAEAVPWRCHRSLIADALLARHIRVEELSSMSSTRPHILTPWARVRGRRVDYPVEGESTSSQGPAQRKIAG
jgi:uncharacterized protein (DUF488 family)